MTIPDSPAAPGDAPGMSLAVRDILEKAQTAGLSSLADAVRLLSLDPDGLDADALRRAAGKAALAWNGGQGSVWFAVGLDSAPCPKSCAFCAFGAQWGLVREPWRIGLDEALAAVREHDLPGVGFIVLRTTDLFPLEELLELARRTRPLRHARLVANIGDFRDDRAGELRRAGFSMIYHALRLREGEDTGLAPAARLRTMQAARSAGIELAALADPIGPEHTAEEIARSLFTHKDAGAAVMGAMARVPVPGTPKGELPMISPTRLAQVTAVARLVAGPLVPWICAHPPDALAAASGANVAVVECGAIPRDSGLAESPWRAFAIADALAMLEMAGYRIEPSTTPP